MSGKAILIYGAESSCTRLMRRIFIAAGCFGNGGLEQSFDHLGIPSAAEVPNIVWGRSVPGNLPREIWPKFHQEWRLVERQGYRIYVIVMIRDWFCMLESQVKTPFKPAKSLQMADAWTQEAYRKLFAALDEAKLPFIIVSFEALQQRPAAFIRRLLEAFELPLPANLEPIYDANEAHYGN